MFGSLRLEMFGRLQRDKEPLSNYVEDIKEAASVLRLFLSESQVVANIIDGLSPSRRSRLVSQQAPVSYEDLSRLCVHDHNIPFSGDLRGQRNANRRAAGLQYHPRASANEFVASMASANNNSVTRKRCFYCRQLGHLFRDCRERARAERERET
jgi:hypothetical protein